MVSYADEADPSVRVVLDNYLGYVIAGKTPDSPDLVYLL